MKKPTIISIPAIKKANVSGSIRQHYEFVYHDRKLAFSLEIPKSVYLVTKQHSEKTVTITQGTPEKIWAPHFFRAFIEDPVQKPVIIRLLKIFRSFRQKLNLNSDQYFEMLLSFVQQLPYDEKKAECRNNDMKEQFQVAKRAYNSEVKIQRARIEEYTERGAWFNQMVAVYNFILENTHNRPGILRELEDNFNFLIKALGRGVL